MSNNSEYPLGYSSSVVGALQKRSASKAAAFLFPYLKETDHLLDCGCGPGSITLDFANILSHGSVMGVDIEQSQIEHSKNLMMERGIQNADFIMSNITKLPFEDHSFDVAYTNAVMWTLADPVAPLTELKRVVKPGGIIACRELCSKVPIYYPESEVLSKALLLQFRAQTALNCDRRFGKKLPFYFSNIGLKNIEFTISSELFHTLEEKRLVAEYFVSSWNETPWSKYIRLKSWATEAEINAFQQAFLDWEGKSGAFLSPLWCQAIGRVP